MQSTLVGGLILVCCLLAEAVIDSEFVIKLRSRGLKFKNCDHVRKSGFTKSGVYTLWMNETSNFKVHCEHTANNSFTVIQRRMYGDVSFAMPWHSYLYGFGNAQRDYWAGLNQIYYLTSTGNNVLTINMQDWNGNNRNAHYSYFTLLDSTSFTLSVSGFSGQVADDLSYNNHMPFATYDRPDHYKCATNQQAGWWYNYCSYALLNGKYYHGPYTPHGGFYDGIYWKDWMGFGYSLKFVSMTLSSS